MRPAQYASSNANDPLNPAQTITTSSPLSRAAAATASRFRRLPRKTRSQLEAAVEDARVPFVVEKINGTSPPSRNSRGEAPTSKPSMR